MKTTLITILISVSIALGLHITLPFPYGFIFGIAIPVFIIWRAIKVKDVNRFSLINYRRADPKTDDELKQNREAYRILKKKFLDEEISKEEFDKLKKDFDDDILKWFGDKENEN
jgi:uncharacterized membrane protein